MFSSRTFLAGFPIQMDRLAIWRWTKHLMRCAQVSSFSAATALSTWAMMCGPGLCLLRHRSASVEISGVYISLDEGGRV